MADERIQIDNVSGRWRVSVSGIVVGHVARTPDVAWSHAPWTIVGDRTMVVGGKGRRKRRGWGTKEAAARELALANSGLVVKALCSADEPDPNFVLAFLATAGTSSGGRNALA